jgi:phosphoenolpyruvate carboxylase
LRNLFVEELHMGDQNINYGQAGSIGRQSTGTINNYARGWEQLKEVTDLNTLATELAQLRTALRRKAETVEEDRAVVAVAEAESEAKNGNGPAVFQKLAVAGNWVLGVAKDIGVKMATEALTKAVGLGGQS